MREGYPLGEPGHELLRCLIRVEERSNRGDTVDNGQDLAYGLPSPFRAWGFPVHPKKHSLKYRQKLTKIFRCMIDRRQIVEQWSGGLGIIAPHSRVMRIALAPKSRWATNRLLAL